MPSANLVLDSTLKPPGDVQAKLLRQIVLSGLGDHVARLVFRLLLFLGSLCSLMQALSIAVSCDLIFSLFRSFRKFFYSIIVTFRLQFRI